MFSPPFSSFSDYSQDEKALLGACDCSQSKWPSPTSVQPPHRHSPVNPRTWQQRDGPTVHSMGVLVRS